MSARILVLNYGMGNIHSMLKALRLYAADVHYSADPTEIQKADALVLPGDGAFAAAMQGLDHGRREALLEHIKTGKALLGVCIGFQILFQNSNEAIAPVDSHEAPQPALNHGLSLVQGVVRKFQFEDASVRVPHMGWNKLEYADHAALHPVLQPGSNDYAYFIHSYRAQDTAPGEVLAYADYAGDQFPAIVAHENILATQFHPEKSDRFGLGMVERWVQSL